MSATDCRVIRFRGGDGDRSAVVAEALLPSENKTAALEEMMPAVYEELRRLARLTCGESAPSIRCNEPRSSTRPICVCVIRNSWNGRIRPTSSGFLRGSCGRL